MKILAITTILITLIIPQSISADNTIQTAVKPYSLTAIPKEHCRRPQRKIELTERFIGKFIPYYYEKIYSQQLLLNHVACDLGAPAEAAEIQPDQKLYNSMTTSVSEGEYVFRYGSYVTTNPVDEISLMFIANESGVVRAIVVMSPKSKKIETLQTLENPLQFSLAKGTYESSRIGKSSTSMKAQSFSLSK